MTTQVSWRADDDLVERARRRARELNQSLNGYLSLVVDAATDPDLAGDEASRLRERLAAAGLLASSPRPASSRPDPSAVAAAAARAGRGTDLAEAVSRGRDE
jgi:hypothetical protein